MAANTQIEIQRVDKSQEAIYLENLQNQGFEHLGEPLQIELDKSIDEIRNLVLAHGTGLNANLITEVENPPGAPGQNPIIVYYVWKSPQPQLPPAEPQPFACPYCTQPFMAIPGTQTQVVACPTCGGANIIPALELPAAPTPAAPSPPPVELAPPPAAQMEQPIARPAPAAPPPPEPAPAPEPTPATTELTTPPAAKVEEPVKTEIATAAPVPEAQATPAQAPQPATAPTPTTTATPTLAPAPAPKPAAPAAPAAPKAPVAQTPAQAAPAPTPAPTPTPTQPQAQPTAQPTKPTQATPQPAPTPTEPAAPAPIATAMPTATPIEPTQVPTAAAPVETSSEATTDESYDYQSYDYQPYEQTTSQDYSTDMPSFDYFTKKAETVEKKPKAPLLTPEYEQSYQATFTSTEQAVKINMQKLAELLANPQNQVKFYDSGELMYPKVTIRKSAYNHLETREMDLLLIKDGVNDYKIIANETHGATGGTITPMQDELFAIKTLGHPSYRAMEDWAYLDDEQKMAVSKCVYAFTDIYFKKLPKPEEGVKK